MQVAIECSGAKGQIFSYSSGEPSKAEVGAWKPFLHPFNGHVYMCRYKHLLELCFSHPSPLFLIFHTQEHFYLFLKPIFCRSSKSWFFSVLRAPKSLTEHSPLCLSRLCPWANTPAQLSLGLLVPVQETLWRVLTHSLLLTNCCLALLD